jgi:hypothetical protein
MLRRFILSLPTCVSVGVSGIANHQTIRPSSREHRHAQHDMTLDAAVGPVYTEIFPDRSLTTRHAGVYQEGSITYFKALPGRGHVDNNQWR